ncbi:MAG: hypothetical protein ACLFQV_02865 [Vulcanimicrobiota bacterium]
MNFCILFLPDLNIDSNRDPAKVNMKAPVNDSKDMKLKMTIIFCIVKVSGLDTIKLIL